MADREYLTTQVYDVSIGGTVYHVSAKVGAESDHSGDITIGGYLTVNGADPSGTAITTTNGGIIVNGPLELTNDGVNSGILTVADDIAVSGGMDVDGSITLNSTAGVYHGTGSPEGSQVAAIGSLFLRTDGGTDTAVYRKESGTGNTGWKATGSATWDGFTPLVDSAYTDYVVQANAISGLGVASLTYTTWKTNQRVLNFPAAGGDYGYFALQLPHGYVEGTDLLWHVHIANPSAIADTETVIFRLTYTVANPFEAFPSEATVDATLTNDSTFRTAHPGIITGTNIDADSHLIVGGATIDGTNFVASTVLHCRIERLSADTHAGDVYLLSADAHYQINRLGSENEYSG